MAKSVDKRSVNGGKSLPSELRQEIATAARDITRFVYGGNRLQNEDPTLLSRGDHRGIEMYEDIERDCHAAAVIQKRKLAIVSREWAIQAGGEDAIDVEAADAVQQQLANLEFDRICLDLLDAVLKGYAVSEVIWEPSGNLIRIARVLARNPRRFVFDQECELKLLTWENTNDGIPVPDRKFIVFRHGSKNGNPYGLGLGTRLFWPVFFKRQGVTFWLTFADKFGSPTAVGKYPSGTDAAGQSRLLSALGALSNDCGVIIPSEMEIEFQAAQQAGSVTTYDSLVRYMDEQISEAVLGETGSTNQSGGGGSRARDQVGNEVRLEVAKADSDMLCSTINETIIRWFVELNFPGAKLPKVWRDFTEKADSRMQAYRDQVLFKMLGLPVSKSYFYRAYSVPEPKAGEELLEIPLDGPGGGAASDASAAFAESLGIDSVAITPARSRNLADQNLFADIAETMAGKFQGMLGKRIEMLLAMLEETGDLKTFRKRLVDLLGGPPPKELVNALNQATFAAKMMGRTQGNEGKKD